MTTQLPPRIVHLAGGLRAIDARREAVSVQLAPNIEFCRFPTPDYSQLYGALKGLKLHPVGIEFVQHEKFADWNFFSADSGFLCLFEGREWSQIRHTAITEKNDRVARISSKVSCYIELANLRVQELSSAYNLNLWASWSTKLKLGHLFGNTYTRRIDAAIHAAVADLASLRDAIAEFIWGHVLREAGSVTRYSSFRSKGSNCSSDIANRFVESGDEGGWLAHFSNLRNNIIHVAPIGYQGAFHNSELREIGVSDKITVPACHFPILTGDSQVWVPRKSEAEFLAEGDAEIRHELDQYRKYVEASQDALIYLHGIVEKMVLVARDARIASSLKGETPHLTDKDIIGEVTFK